MEQFSGFQPGDFILLGIAHHADAHGLGMDILQLSPVVYLPVFPQQLGGLRCIIAVKPGALCSNEDIACALCFADTTKPELAVCQPTVISPVTVAGGEDGRPETLVSQGRATAEAVQFWNNSYDVMALRTPPLTVFGPTFVSVFVEIYGHRYGLGHLVVAHTVPPPLTVEERRALASRANAVQAAVYTEVRLWLPLCEVLSSTRSLLALQLPRGAPCCPYRVAAVA